MCNGKIAPLAACAYVLFLVLVARMNGETDIPAATVVSQADVGENSCGPCAIYNAMANGSRELQEAVARFSGNSPQARVQELINRWGKLPTKVYKDNRGRYTPAHGIASTDMTDLTNDVLSAFGKIRVTGGYADRRKDEKQEDHLNRLFRIFRASLEAGFPPIVEIRSFSARPAGDEFQWNGILGHYVAILEVTQFDAKHERGFVFKYADSYTGCVETGYIHIESRNFTATRDFSVEDDGTEKWEWISEYPYLTVASPTLVLGTDKEKWHSRTILALRYAICAGGSEKKGN
jgi:hypothetical protein